jgi:cell wall-associated NlpC family hydrolase
MAAVFAATAEATPKEQIAAKRQQAVAAKAKIDALSRALEPAIERWNAATEELRGVRERIAANRRRLGAVDVSIERSRKLLADRLREEYRAGNPDPLGTVLASGSITDMLATADLLKRSERQTADLLTSLQVDERELEARRTQLAADEKRSVELERRAQAEKATIENGIAEQQRLRRGLEREIEQLVAAERRRQARLIAEAKARLAAERRAAERRRAAAAAAAAAQDDPGIGGSAPADPAPVAASGGSGGEEIAAPPPPSNGSLGQRAVAVAMRYLGVPYVWGGESPSGFDCSGLTKFAYAQVGVGLSHYTGSQWNEGARVSSMSDLQPGDLVFFHSDLHHMGMYIGGGQMIHAPHTGDVVKITSITSGYYAGSFQGGVRPG